MGISRRPRLYTGRTRASGIWKTTNGGENWNNITAEALPATGIVNIAVHDNNTTSTSDEIIYATTQFYGTEANVYNIGLIYSTNNGITWTQDYSMDTDADLIGKSFLRTGNIGMLKLYFEPETYKLYVTNGTYIYIKDISTLDWTIFKNINDFSADPDHAVNEIDFLPGDNDFIVLSPTSGRCRVCKTPAARERTGFGTCDHSE